MSGCASVSPLRKTSLVPGGLRVQPRPKMILAFVGNGEGAVAVAFKKAKRHGAYFGTTHILLEFPFDDFVEGWFVHGVFLAQSEKT